MNRYHITFKNGLQNPVDIDAENIDDAKKRGFAYHLLNSGFVETVNLKSTFDTTIDTITEIK